MQQSEEEKLKEFCECGHEIDEHYHDYRWNRIMFCTRAGCICKMFVRVDFVEDLTPFIEST